MSSFTTKSDEYKEWEIPQEANFPMPKVLVPRETTDLVLRIIRTKDESKNVLQKLTIGSGNVAQLPGYEAIRKRRWRAKGQNRNKENKNQRLRHKTQRSAESAESRALRLQKRRVWYARRKRRSNGSNLHNLCRDGSGVERYASDKSSTGSFVETHSDDEDSSYSPNSSIKTNSQPSTETSSDAIQNPSAESASSAHRRSQCPFRGKNYLYEITVESQTLHVFHHLLIPIPTIPKSGYREVPVYQEKADTMKTGEESSQIFAGDASRSSSNLNKSDKLLIETDSQKATDGELGVTKGLPVNLKEHAGTQRDIEAQKYADTSEDAEQIMLDVFGPDFSDDESDLSKQ